MKKHNKSTLTLWTRIKSFFIYRNDEVSYVNGKVISEPHPDYKIGMHMNATTSATNEAIIIAAQGTSLFIAEEGQEYAPCPYVIDMAIPGEKELKEISVPFSLRDKMKMFRKDMVLLIKKTRWKFLGLHGFNYELSETALSS